MSLKICPWENGEEPFFINGNIEWYTEKNLTDYCTEEKHDWPILNAVSFLVVEVSDSGKRNPVDRVLICKETNNILATDKTLDGMACKIEALRLART